MDKFERQLKEMMHASGATLVRDGRHIVFRVGTEDTFIMSKTPSDRRSSRIALATYKRIINRDRVLVESPEPSEKLPAETAKQRTTPIPNNPPCEHAEVVIPSLDVLPERALSRVPDGRFSTVIEVLAAADKSDLFWALDPCGRIRVLERIVRRFAAVEILPVLFCKASIEEILNHYDSVEGEEEMSRILTRQAALYTRLNGQWGLSGIPSLLVRDPIVGKIIVEASAWSFLEQINFILIREATRDDGAIETASEVWSNGVQRSKGERLPDHVIFLNYIMPRLMKRKGFKLHTCANWTDHTKTHPAIRQVLDIAHSNL